MAERVKKNLVLGYSPYEYPGSISPFDVVFQSSKDVKKEGFTDIDCFILWGGKDIHPSLYHQKPHRLNQASDVMSERDVFEHKAVLYCKKNNIPMIGVCRGAQLLCAEAGGSVIQHVMGHGYDHEIDTIKNKRFKTTSVHHQMMNPYSIKHTLIAWADLPRSTKYEGENGKDVDSMYTEHEPEIVYFPQLNGLAIQGHPEYFHASKDFVDFCNSCILEYLFVKG